MPNWCNGYVKVKGKPEDIKRFCRLFIFEEECGTKEDMYFGRSFIHQSWKEFNEEYLGEDEAEFCIDFAWSCWSCMFDGYPNGKECVTNDQVKQKQASCLNCDKPCTHEVPGFLKSIKRIVFRYECYICTECQIKWKVYSNSGNGNKSTI